MREDARETSALVGRRVGEFVIRDPLSSGGFGLVYRAEQPALGREAVIKVLHQRLRASETVLARFLREAKLASRLDHPYAAHIYAFGAEPDGLMWIAMELVRGTTLDRMLEASGPIALERFVPLLERICQVVQTAHDQGIVHRDLKPANVMVLSRAGQLLPKLLDFGIAKLDHEVAAAANPAPRAGPIQESPVSLADTEAPTESSGENGRLTEHGAVIGSPYYMAPEQWLDAASVDARTDIYALAVMSYETLTGSTPFPGASRIEIARAHAKRAPPPLGRGLPAELDVVLARALAKRAEDRYGSALEFATAFRTASGLVSEVEELPRLADALRADVSVRMPQPIAAAVAAFHGARHVHQARDALRQLVRVVVRYCALIAIASHGHVGSGTRVGDPSVGDAFRKLRQRSLADAAWLGIAAELGAPFRTVRAAYPVPELIDMLETSATPLHQLVQRIDGDSGGTEAEIRSLLVEMLPEVERVLAQVAFLGDYALVVLTDAGAIRWMGSVPTQVQAPAMRRDRVAVGHPMLVDHAGIPILTLWPFIQIAAPAPGVPERPFLLEGKGRRGGRLIALPESFERDDEQVWDALGGLVDADSSHATSDREVCPYPGLSSFGTSDASRFFGRERETEAFVNRLRVQPLLALVGPSGAGKSSFVQAGVIPALPETWHVVVLRPGPAPLLSLATRLSSLVDPKVLHAELVRDPSSLGTILRTRNGSETTLIVVDQLEEVFTLCDDPDERARFLEALVRAARSADEPVRVVFTLRDDFLLRAESSPALHTRLAPALHLLTSPGRDELLRILCEPLRLAGYEFDDAQLVHDMVDSLSESRSPLALLSFTAAKLWELRDRRFRQITRNAYTSLGGVGGALSQHAETTLAEMRPEEQRLVREVFRYLVTADGTRAVMPFAELERLIGGGAQARHVLERLVVARLLVIAESPTGEDQIEVVHEALIGSWARLAAWHREDAEGARLRDQLRAAAKQWSERRRPSGLLWHGDALAEFRMWRSRHTMELGDLETAFIEASLDDARRARRRRTVAIASALSILSVGVVFLLILNARVASQRGRAERSQRQAEASATQAAASAATLRDTLMVEYEDQGRRNLVDGAPMLALLYLEEARGLGSRGVAHDLAVAFSTRLVENLVHDLPHLAPVTVATFSDDGKRAITASYDRTAKIWDVETGKLLLSVTGTRPLRWVNLSGDELWTGTVDGTCSSWDAATGARRTTFACGTGDRKAILFAPTGSIISVGMDDVVTVWGRDGTLRATLQPAPHASGEGGLFNPAALSRDGKRLAVGDGVGALRIWDLDSLSLRATSTAHTAEIRSVQFSPDERTLVVAGADATVTTHDATSGALRLRLQHHDGVNAAAFSPDGLLVATGATDGAVATWDTRSGRLERSFSGHAGEVTSLAFSPDGRQLASASDSKTTLIHDPQSGFLYARLVGHQSMVATVEYDPTGTRVITAGLDNRGILWTATPQYDATPLANSGVWVDVSSDDKRIAAADEHGVLRIFDRQANVVAEVAHPTSIWFVAFSPDSSQVATASDDGAIRVFDARTGAAKLTLRGHEKMAYTVAWFADGKRLASTGQDGTVRIWDLAAQSAVIHRPHGGLPVYSLALTRDGLAVTTGNDLSTRVWDTTTLKERVAWSDRMVGVSFDLGGRRLVGTNGASARIWGLDGTTLLEVRGPRAFRVARLVANDELLLTTSYDGSITLWDAVRGNEVVTLHGDSMAAWAAVTRDLRSLVTPLAVWHLPSMQTDLREVLRCRVPFQFHEGRIVSRPVAGDCQL